MKMWKWSKLSTALLGVALFVSACGGGDNNDPAAGKSSSTNEPGATEKAWTGEIVVWDGPRWSDDKENKYHWIENKKAEFEKLHPGVTIKIVQTPWAEMEDKLNVSIAGGAWPDLVYNVSNRMASIKNIESGIVEPIDEFYTADELADFYPNALKEYEYEGKHYGVPVSTRVHSLLLNLEIFKQKGVEPPVDGKWTYDEFLEKMKQLTGGGVHGFSTYIMPSYYEAWPFLMMDGGRPLSDDLTQYTFDSPEAISGLQKFLDLKFVHEVALPDMGMSNVGDTYQAFAAQDKRLMAVQPWNSWAIASSQKEPYAMDLMVAEYPTGDSGKSISMGDVLGWVMLKQKDEGKKQMAMEFVKFLTTTEEIFITAKNYGVFPSRISSGEQRPFEANPQMERAQQIAENAMMVPRHTNWQKIDEAIQKELQLAVNGTKTAEQALKDARSQVESLLK
ncbi:ABC transporter substrate-binding protein [Paenibacillus agaridevorans]|uniref:ABC transporter substrate-binding protein n=1 Tax=Paenibacillus agaridevorans TaxID=171404 RepID=A0A2R5ENH1_9BACL|nr:extracellular solute-binding protein [Paenibacillus agaridevorans]GBG08220.1 ABC transporter substrate-binding protein [Paenibacillus agaridevorans]